MDLKQVRVCFVIYFVYKKYNFRNKIKFSNLGNPAVTLHAADSNIPVPVMISLAGEKIWRAAYTITIPGNYLLSVLWAGRPVKGCPLVVEAKGGADASKVSF